MKTKEIKKERLSNSRSTLKLTLNKGHEANKEKLFEIKEISIQQTLACQYKPGCDCTAY